MYNYIIFNLDNLSVSSLDTLLLELELQINALFLKLKFNDKRDIPTLVKLIKEEYKLG